MNQETCYRATLRDYIREQALPVDKFSHQARLYALAVSLAGEAPFDDDVLFAAAWLHDLGVFWNHRPSDPVKLAQWDNVGYAVAKTPGILKGLRFPEDKIPAVCEAISTHLPSGKPASTEATLLRDADILEQLGAVGILRTVSKVGRDTRFQRFEDALRLLQNNLETLPAMLLLEASRQEALLRVRSLQSFLDSARSEAKGVEW
jgi:uncharacterized protein